MRSSVALLLLGGCSAALDFDPEGLPCEGDEHCPGGTVCGAAQECVAAGGSGGGGEGEGEGEGAAGFAGTPRLVGTRPLPEVGAPVGLAGNADGSGLLVADFVDDRIATPDGVTVCTLPDVGIRALARWGGDVFTLHASRLYRVTLDGCGSVRIGLETSGDDLAIDGNELLELDGERVRVRSAETGVVTRQVDLDDLPATATRLAASGGWWFVAEHPGGRVAVHLYDARAARTVATRTRTIDFGTTATAVAGLLAAPGRLWLLARGGDYGEASLAEVAFE